MIFFPLFEGLNIWSFTQSGCSHFTLQWQFGFKTFLSGKLTSLLSNTDVCGFTCQSVCLCSSVYVYMYMTSSKSDVQKHPSFSSSLTALIHTTAIDVHWYSIQYVYRHNYACKHVHCNFNTEKCEMIPRSQIKLMFRLGVVDINNNISIFLIIIC